VYIMKMFKLFYLVNMQASNEGLNFWIFITFVQVFRKTSHIVQFVKLVCTLWIMKNFRSLQWSAFKYPKVPRNLWELRTKDSFAIVAHDTFNFFSRWFKTETFSLSSAKLFRRTLTKMKEHKGKTHWSVEIT
jgi:hypothetical protein